MDRKLFRSYMLLIVFAVVLVLAVMRFDMLLQGANVLLGLLKPFFIGFAIAFVLNIPYMAIRNNLDRYNTRMPKLNKPLAIAGAYLLCFGIVGGVIAIVIPELVQSVNQLISNSETYKQNFQNALVWLSSFDISPLAGLDWSQLFSSLERELQLLLEQTVDLLRVLFPQIYDKASGFIHGIVNVFVGLVVSVYLINGKETLCRQAKRLVYAFLPKRLAEECIDVSGLMNQCFSNFISGQLMEACILGLMCFAGMNIFGFEYAFLISLMIGVTAIVPIVGAFIGTVPAVFLLFLVEPMQAVWFLVFILVLQQLVGHIIYPKVVGESVGLPALWVLLGIMAGGGLGGVPGMLLGVPLLTVGYKLLSRTIQSRLDVKKISV